MNSGSYSAFEDAVSRIRENIAYNVRMLILFYIVLSVQIAERY